MKKLILIILAYFSLISCNDNSQHHANNPIQKDSIPTNSKNMLNKNYTTSIIVGKNPQEAFKAITNFRAWWSEEIKGPTDQLNGIFFYHYKDVHLSKIKLIKIVPNEKLVYQVMDNQFNFTKDKSEWIGTKLIFELFPEGNQTKIVFTHEGLTPAYECYQVCEDAWTSYIQGSLKSLINTGKGKPNAKEGGLNAELVEKWGLPNK